MIAQVRGEVTSFEAKPQIYALPSLAPDDAADFGSSAPTPNEISSTGTNAEADPLRKWLGQRLTALNRPLTPNEQNTLTTLQSIWRSGRVYNTWTDLQFPVQASLARDLLDNCADGTFVGLGLEGEGGTLQIFGRRIALGRERLLFFQVRLVNQSMLRAALADQSADATITIRFAPGENNASEAAYFDKPQLLSSLPLDTDTLGGMEIPVNYRPGQWRILTTPPLLAPIELAPTDEEIPSGWRLDIPDRVQAKFHHLDRDERAATLNLLWAIQRRGGRTFLARHSTQSESTADEIYVIRPTLDLRVLIRPHNDSTLKVADIVYSETLRQFRER